MVGREGAGLEEGAGAVGTTEGTGFAGRVGAEGTGFTGILEVVGAGFLPLMALMGDPTFGAWQKGTVVGSGVGCT